MTSTREVMRLAKAAGFSEFKDAGQVKAGAKLVVNGRDRAVILVVVGSDPIVSGSRVIGTHHDSPHIDLKARPIYASSGFTLFKTIYYGGIKKYQWANRPLALIGRVDTVDGKRVDVSIGLKEGDPVFVIPDNAPHSDKSLHERKYKEVFAGEELDPVVGSIPGQDSSVDGAGPRGADLDLRDPRGGLRLRRARSSCRRPTPPTSASTAASSAPTGRTTASRRTARPAPCWTSRARPSAPRSPTSRTSRRSARSTTRARLAVLELDVRAAGRRRAGQGYTDLDLRQALRALRGRLGRHERRHQPVFPQTSEPSGAARLGFGATIKRYGAGFDANSEFIAKIRGLLDKNGDRLADADAEGRRVLGRHDRRLPLAWEMEVIDMGVPLLSMHAPFEMSSKVDVWSFYRFMGVFLGVVGAPRSPPASGAATSMPSVRR